MSGEAPYRPPLGVAPSVAMDGPALPRRGLSAGAIGHGSHGRRYRLLAPMERGGMGELFLTLVSEPGRPDDHVVIKRLLADLVDDPKYVEMFKSEAWVMQRLEHPNIVGVYDLPVIDRAQCLAMELVRGKSAQQILSKCEATRQRVPPTVALTIMGKILRALEYAHGFRLDDGAPLNLVHRDVSPGNVLISYEGDVKLTDFGIAKSQMSVVSTTVGIVKGKARYLAPEQILGEPASPRSDIFSAAAVTCELLTGEPTFDCSSVPKTLYAIVNGERSNLTEVLDFRAPMLVQLLDRALATDPAQRVQTAAELASGFEAQVRVLGAQIGAPAVGDWVRDLFADEEDSLGQFFAEAPAPEDHAATEHGYRPETPVPTAEAPDTVLERAHAPSIGIETEVLERPSPADIPAGRASTVRGGAPAFRATIAGHETEPPDAVPPDAEPAPAKRTRRLVEAELIDPGPEVHGEREPTQVVRQRRPRVEDQSSVGEALSMLAYLQQQKGRATPPPAPAAAPTPAPKVTPRTPPPDAGPLPDLKPRRGGQVALLLVGALLGVLGTLGVQALLPEPPPKIPALPPPAPAALVPLPEPETPPEPPAEVAAAQADPEAPATPAAAILDVTYPRGAKVWLDGEAIGRVPIRDLEIPDGPHELRVRKRRYRRKVEFDAQPGLRFEMKKKLVQTSP